MHRKCGLCIHSWGILVGVDFCHQIGRQLAGFSPMPGVQRSIWTAKGQLRAGGNLSVDLNR